MNNNNLIFKKIGNGKAEIRSKDVYLICPPKVLFVKGKDGFWMWDKKLDQREYDLSQKFADIFNISFEQLNNFITSSCWSEKE